MKFIITEEEKNRIRGLYEQTKSGCTGNPDSTNMININVYITKNLVEGNSSFVPNVLFEILEDYSNNSPNDISIGFSKNVPLNNTQRLLQFQIDAKYKNSMKQSKWLYDYFNGFSKILKDTFIQQLNLPETSLTVSNPNYNWGAYFESEPTNCPDLCIGVAYKIDYKP